MRTEMGFSLSWVAVRGMPASEVLAELRLRGTGDYEEIPESPITGAATPGGWYIVVANRFDFIDGLPLDRMSSRAEIVTCAVEEHVMTSAATGWSQGRLRWWVRHEAEQNIRHLDTHGELPPAFAPIRERQSRKQDEAGRKPRVDYVFDVPIELAKAVTGFRHDDCPEDGVARFERLTR